jgi:hypothetical protein
LGIIPKRRRKRRPISDVKKIMTLFIVFFGLTIVVHETFHLIVARALGYEANVFYGVQFPNIYGFVSITPSPKSAIDTILIFSAGGLGAGTVLYILWSTIDDIMAKLLLSFFTPMQIVYGVMEPMYGFGIFDRSLLGIVPTVAGLISLIIFRIIYRRRGYW